MSKNNMKNDTLIKIDDFQILGKKDLFQRKNESTLPEYRSIFKSEKIANILAKELISDEWEIGGMIVLYRPTTLWIMKKEFDKEDTSGRPIAKVATCKYDGFTSNESLSQVIISFLSYNSLSEKIIIPEKIVKDKQVEKDDIKRIINAVFYDQPFTFQFTESPLEGDIYSSFLIALNWIGFGVPFCIRYNENNLSFHNHEYLPRRTIDFILSNKKQLITDKKTVVIKEISQLIDFISSNYIKSFVDVLIKISSSLPIESDNRFNYSLFNYIFLIEKNITQSSKQINDQSIFEIASFFNYEYSYHKINDNKLILKINDHFRYKYLIQFLDRQVVNPRIMLKNYSLPLVLCKSELYGTLYLNPDGFTSDSFNYFLEIISKYEKESQYNLTSFKAVSDIYISSMKTDMNLLSKSISSNLFNPVLLTIDDWKLIWKENERKDLKQLSDIIIKIIKNFFRDNVYPKGIGEFLFNDHTVWDNISRYLNSEIKLWLVEKFPQKAFELSVKKKYLDDLLLQSASTNFYKILVQSIPQDKADYKISPKTSFKFLEQINDYAIDTTIERMINLFCIAKMDDKFKYNSAVFFIKWICKNQYNYEYWPKDIDIFSDLFDILDQVLIKEYSLFLEFIDLLPPPWKIINLTSNLISLPHYSYSKDVLDCIFNSIESKTVVEHSCTWLLLIISLHRSVTGIDFQPFFKFSWIKQIVNKQNLDFWEKIYINSKKNNCIYFIIETLLVYELPHKKYQSLKIGMQNIGMFLSTFCIYCNCINMLPNNSFDFIKYLGKLLNLKTLPPIIQTNFIEQISVEVSKHSSSIVDKIMMEIEEINDPIKNIQNSENNNSYLTLLRLIFLNYFINNLQIWCSDKYLNVLIEISKSEKSLLFRTWDCIKNSGSTNSIFWLGVIYDKCNLDNFETFSLLRTYIGKDWPMIADSILVNYFNEEFNLP